MNQPIKVPFSRKGLAFRFAVFLQTTHAFEWVTVLVPLLWAIVFPCFFREKVGHHFWWWVWIPYVVFIAWVFISYYYGGFYIKDEYVQAKKATSMFGDGRFSVVVTNAFCLICLLFYSISVMSLHENSWGLFIRIVAIAIVSAVLFFSSLELLAEHEGEREFSDELYDSMKVEAIDG